MKEVVHRGRKIVVIESGGVVQEYKVVSRIRDKKPRPERDVFENLGEGEQLERTFFEQDKEQIALVVGARRARNPKRIDHTVLPRG